MLNRVRHLAVLLALAAMPVVALANEEGGDTQGANDNRIAVEVATLSTVVMVGIYRTPQALEAAFTQAAAAADAVPGLWQAGLWGLLRSARSEHPDQ